MPPRSSKLVAVAMAVAMVTSACASPREGPGEAAPKKDEQGASFLAVPYFILCAASVFAVGGAFNCDYDQTK